MFLIKLFFRIIDGLLRDPAPYKEGPSGEIVKDNSVTAIIGAHMGRAMLVLLVCAVFAFLFTASTLHITVPAAIVIGEITADEYTQNVSYTESANGVITIVYDSSLFSADGLRLCLTQPPPDPSLSLEYINNPLGQPKPWDWLCFENQDTIMVYKDSVIIDPDNSILRPQIRLAKIVTAKYWSDWYMLCWWETESTFRCSESFQTMLKALDK